jgi:hypothetical protein
MRKMLAVLVVLALGMCATSCSAGKSPSIPTAQAGRSLKLPFVRHGPDKTIISAKGDGSLVCPIEDLNATVQRGRSKKQFTVIRSSASPDGAVELELWAPFDGVLVAHVSKAVTAVSWQSSTGQVFDHMVPRSQWVVEAGPIAPESANVFVLSQGDLIAYTNTKVVATLVVNNADTVPPVSPTGGNSPCATATPGAP